MWLQGDWFYSLGAASASSLRYYIDQLIAAKTVEIPADGRLSDWDAIRRMNMACPFPWAFESFALRASGKMAKADDIWAAALQNQFLYDVAFGDSGCQLKYTEARWL